MLTVGATGETGDCTFTLPDMLPLFAAGHRCAVADIARLSFAFSVADESSCTRTVFESLGVQIELPSFCNDRLSKSNEHRLCAADSFNALSNVTVVYEPSSLS